MSADDGGGHDSADIGTKKVVEPPRPSVEPPLPSHSEPVPFSTVFASELAAINARRNRLHRAYPSFGAPNFPENQPTGRDRGVIDAVGLAISGGGIRSAAFGLGVLQALDAVHDPAPSDKTKHTASLLDRVDYLSTVSGGGYIGCSLSAHLSNRQGDFPFRSELDQDETPSIQYIRNHSNYLFPNGILDVLDSVAIYLRGLLANFVIIVPLLLLFAVFTILCSPKEDDLLNARFYQYVVGRFGDWFPAALKFESFGFTKLLFALSTLLFLVWGARSVVERMKDFNIWAWIADVVQGLRELLLPRSKGKPTAETRNFSETRSRWTRAGGVALFVLVLCAFCEMQPLLLKRLFDFAGTREAEPTPHSDVFWIQVATALLAAIASIVSFWSDKLEKLTRHFPQGVGWLARLGHYSGMIVIYVASAAVPLVLWWMYLATSFWGVQSEKFAKSDRFAAPHKLIEWAQSFFSTTPLGSAEQGNFTSLLNFVLGLPVVSHLVGVVTWLAKWVNDNGSPIAGTYFLIAVILFILSLIPALNANSLHRLYRDRLSTAFIFCFFIPVRGLLARVLDWCRRNLLARVPKVLGQPQGWEPEGQVPELRLLDQFKLSQLSACYAPYHIINTALNVQGSAYVNQRARNADFFMLSRNYIGSEATQYAATTQMESVARDLNLATAMAVSGAAASPNMGSSTIRPLTPTLTILNVRLGYWLRNPKDAVGFSANRVIAWFAETANWYFLKEMFSRLDEKTHNVYLTDGGHIENLGIYELLKRRCKLIIASDAEADSEMNFESLVKLQVHARIDLGIRIELPWQPIRDCTLSTGKMIADKDEAMPDVRPAAGPHCALGIIHYPKEEVGYLLYIKSSMTGDENDYIVNYKQRHPSFPHETTGDQFFTEQQFEAYRALGFHAMHRAVTGEDVIATHAGGARRPLLRKWNSTAKTGNPFPEIKRLLQL